MNDEHKVDAVLQALREEGIEVDYSTAERIAAKVIAARRRLDPVKPADPHLGWIYDVRAEMIAAASTAVDTARADIPNLELRMRLSHVHVALADYYGVAVDDVERARYQLRQGKYVDYPAAAGELVEYRALPNRALNGPAPRPEGTPS